MPRRRRCWRPPLRLVEHGRFSSLHLQFADERDTERCRAAGLSLRKDCQFHWHNRGYRDFDEFLAGFTAAKRKKVRRERRRVREAGLSFRHLGGRDIDAGLWAVVHALISTTFMARGSLPYYNLEFFQRLAAARPDDLLVILAEDAGGNAVAAAVCYRGADRLYGRYWGSDGFHDSLHFETCYYQGIDYCIRHGLSVFEPGTQGEHKIARGFEPVNTHSAHWLAEPRFNDAVERYLREEGRRVDRYVAAVEDHVPYRQNGRSDA